MSTQTKFALSLIVFAVVPAVARRDSDSPSCTQMAELARGIPGAFVPSCEADGSFSASQCHGSTGHCWCSTFQGEEIIGSRTGPLDNRFDCSHLPECIVRSHEAQSRRMPGTFIPQCEADGTYKLEQCHTSSGHCWCVSADGEEVQGTRRSAASRMSETEGKFDCWNLPECLRSSHETRQRHLLGAFLPTCEADGSFSTKQCHSSTGNCWCVDPSNGLEISGTRRGPNEQALECGDKLPLCLRMAYETSTAANGMMLVGSYVPQCDEQGRFLSRQCHGSTGHCWCVMPTGPSQDDSTSFKGEGVEIIGTRRGPGERRMDCDSLPKCLTDAHVARITHSSPSSTAMVAIGAHVPQCDADGFFAIQQCRRSTGYCWCVSREDGHEIAGTRRAPGDERGQMDCANLPSCLAAADQAFVSSSGMVGAFIPQCNEVDGSYQRKQCHASSGHCWCVDVSGRKIVGTVRSPVELQFETCEVEEVPECLMTVHEATFGAPRLGQFVPTCETDGSFSPKQCHGSTGQCWCVDVRGREIEGTRTRAGDERRSVMQCGATVPECLKQAHEARTRQSQQRNEMVASASSNSFVGVLVGVYVPQCDSDGSFSSTQCHGSTGHCWCVDDKGVELLGSRRTPSESRPDCTRRVLSQCQLEAKRAQETHVLGMFVPQCSAEDGSYRTKQCHGSTGHCWCVDVNGAEVLGSRSTPLHKTPITEDCDHLHSCLVTAHNRRHQGSLHGAYIPQCDTEDGSYTTVQCHASTGFCWCSSANGVEVPNTRVRGTPECPSQTVVDSDATDDGVVIALPVLTEESSDSAAAAADDEEKSSSLSGSTSGWGKGGAIAVGLVAGVVGSVLAVAVMLVMRKPSAPLLPSGPYAPLNGQ